MKGVAALRMRLVENGYTPLPLYGKEPPVYRKNNPRKGLPKWQQLQAVTREQIDMWSKIWPDAVNTGCLCRSMPTLDADILSEEPISAAPAHVGLWHIATIADQTLCPLLVKADAASRRQAAAVFGPVTAINDLRS